MKIVSSAYLIFFVICISGCFGGAPRIIRYDIYRSGLNIETDHFLESFSGFLKDNGYKAKLIDQDDRKSGNYSLSDGNGNYLILLEASKGYTTVRICKINTRNLFIQVVQVASILIWNPDEHLEKESNMIRETISSNFPYLRIKQENENL